ncbi:hypothetical protein SK128_022463 [Halocaridina rubra]|uniref:Uncharacterized protein n=1 Tax=Halocaridina rubra TaxID=373956 RepID=A0AAN8WIR2_HALRR
MYSESTCSHRGSSGSVRNFEALGRGFAPRHGLRLARAYTQEKNQYKCTHNPLYNFYFIANPTCQQ